MRTTRRQSIVLGGGALVATALAGAGRAQNASATAADSHETAGGEIVIRPVEHASFVMQTPALVIYADPVGGAALYEGMPPPGLILVTHEHSDHLDVPTLTALAGENTRLLTNPAVHAMLPAELQAKATAIANGESTTANDIAIEAIPAYNTTADRLQYHPKGRDNGYVLDVGGTRVYIAGDTEDIPEMRALTDIDVAFVPMNLPYTMTIEQAADGVAAFAPGVVYPYHSKGSDIEAFAALVGEKAPETEVLIRDWYAGA
jgi:L-ascorbate metabolism protein UlaG (beta-lactamase superfamily)